MTMNDHPLNILKDIKKPTRLQDHLGCDSITNRMFQRNDQSNDKFIELKEIVRMTMNDYE